MRITRWPELLLLAYAVVSASPAGAMDLKAAVLQAPDLNARIAKGNAHIYGLGVERDHIKALMWFMLAGSKDHMRLLVPYMSETQKSKAAALAEICEASGFRDCG
jgi:TPR repeat protein